MRESKAQQFVEYVAGLEQEVVALREENQRLQAVYSAVGELVETLGIYQQWVEAGKPLPALAAKHRRAAIIRSYGEAEIDAWVEMFQAGKSIKQIADETESGIETVRKHLRERGIYASKLDLLRAMATPATEAAE